MATSSINTFSQQALMKMMMMILSSLRFLVNYKQETGYHFRLNLKSFEKINLRRVRKINNGGAYRAMKRRSFSCP